ncbi:MAG: zinc-ribbon domain-containing protein [Bacteroidales bacterium]|nr:zinc-ribbon domain-containing protein [Bacteroidales bacterium]
MTVTCPYCGDTLDLPEPFSARTIRCRSCQTTFAPHKSGTLPSAESWESHAHEEGKPNTHAARHRPNGRIWLLGILSLLVFGGCTSGCVLSILLLIFPRFEPITHAAGQFTAVFPDPPDTLSQVWNETFPAVGLEAQRGFTQERYFALYADLPAAEWRADTKGVLPQVAAWVAESFPGCREVQREFTFHDGYEAFDIRYAFANTPDMLILRVIRRDHRVFVIGVDGSISPSDPRVQEFFVRFRVHHRQE